MYSGMNPSGIAVCQDIADAALFCVGRNRRGHRGGVADRPGLRRSLSRRSANRSPAEGVALLRGSRRLVDDRIVLLSR